MKFLKILVIALAVPLGSCAAIQSAGFGDPEGFEDLPEAYNLFFGYDSAELDEAAEGILEQAAADAMQFEPDAIIIAGSSQPGPGETTPGLIEARFGSIETALAAHGADRALFERADLMPDPSLPSVDIPRFEIRFEFD